MGEQELNHAVQKMMEELDQMSFRPIQKKGYLCSAKCLDQKQFSTQQVQQCVENCQQPLVQVQNLLNQELQAFQSRLQRCGMDCQDRITDQMPTDGQPSEAKMAELQGKMDSCVATCGKDLMKLLPSLKKRIEGSVKQFN